MVATTCTSFYAGDQAAQTSALDSLAPAATDIIVTYSVGNVVYVSKTTAT